jgi:hypothetical protein
VTGIQYAHGDLANYKHCLVEVQKVKSNGKLTVEVIECEDDSVEAGTVYTVSADDLHDILEDE